MLEENTVLTMHGKQTWWIEICSSACIGKSVPCFHTDEIHPKRRGHFEMPAGDVSWYWARRKSCEYK